MNEEITHTNLITANLPTVLDWLHKQAKPKVFESHFCDIPLLLFEHELSTQKLIFHYDGTSDSYRVIKNFMSQFGPLIKESHVIIISPCFIPKSKISEERELIQLAGRLTRETSFIKFNFNKISDFLSYAAKNQCTLLVTTKRYQAELAKVLCHFYKGEWWYNRLSIYLAR